MLLNAFCDKIARTHGANGLVCYLVAVDCIIQFYVILGSVGFDITKSRRAELQLREQLRPFSLQKFLNNHVF